MALELISPAQNMEMLQAAVQTGADGVYLIAPVGETRDTFTTDELIEAIKYTRLRGARAYVYLGGLVTDEELLKLKGLIEDINEAGAHAVVAGDMGLIRMIRNLAPDLAIFGSEHIAVHNLAGAMAANSTLPVIGIPMKSSVLDGMDALLATVMMPSGVPVATVAINGAKNAALLAIQMLSLADSDLADKLALAKEKLREETEAKDAKAMEIVGL